MLSGERVNTRAKVPSYDPDRMDAEIEQRFTGLLVLQRAMAQGAFYAQSIAECEKIFATKAPNENESSN